MTTELNTEGGMHIPPDPKTGAIAASNVAAVEETKPKDDQPEQTPEAEANGEKLSPRELIMQKIYANRGEQFEKELEYAATVSAGGSIEPILEEQVKEQSDPVPEEKIEEKPKAEPATAAQTKRVTIGQQQFDLTDKELEQLAQRTLYAEQQARQQYQPQPQYQQPQQQYQQPVQQGDDTGILKDIARRITYGSEEESVRALADFAGLTARLASANQIPPEQLVQVAKNQAIAEMNFTRNLESISSEYADIFESRAKSLVAADKVGNLRQKYMMLQTPRSDLDLYREACSMARQEFGGSSVTSGFDDKTQKSAQPLTAVVNQTRVERKRAAPQPAGAVNKVQPMQQSNRGVTSSDVVAAMRASRGQPAA